MLFKYPRPASLQMVFGLAALLAACAGGPPAPDWQVNSAAHLRRYSQAWLKGNTRVAQHEFALARQEAASTGQAVQVARVELTRCALQAAALDFAPCEGFEALRADAPPAETAYAAWLAGQAGAGEAALLPAAYRALAAQGAGAPAQAAQAALQAIEDPVSRLVAAGVLMRQQRISPGVAELAAQTASAQGWRRPLLAWLGVQKRLALQDGQAAEAARLQRQMDLVAAPDAAKAAQASGAPGGSGGSGGSGDSGAPAADGR